MSDIKSTLAERGKLYGDYASDAKLCQAFKATMHHAPGWQRLTSDQQQTLEMIATKMARILNGDPNTYDSWHDIAGYATLSADLVMKRKLSTMTFPLDLVDGE